jgi:GMP synthase (glutamine-hydrolysing)
VLGGSYSLQGTFDAEEFIRRKLSEINNAVRGEGILLACSGGVCSNVAAALVLKATGGTKVTAAFIDTGFMRENEVERVSEILTRAPLKLDLKVIDARKQFMKAIERAEFGTEKRMVFSEVFGGILQNFAEKVSAGVIVKGTSATGKASMDESTKPFASKSNLRSSPLLMEPLINLNRAQVLNVAHKMDLPPRLSDANPFPAPGLLIRVVGRVNDERIKEVRRATNIVEEELQYTKPTQYFAAIIEDREDEEPRIEKLRERISDLLDVGASQVEVKIPQSRVAGLEDGKRVYQKISAIRVTLLKSKELLQPDYDDLTNLPIDLKERHKDFARFSYCITEKPRNGKYIAVIRAVVTEDFGNAEAAKLDWTKLCAMGARIMNESGKISSVYYDVTPKPPAAIELE